MRVFNALAGMAAAVMLSATAAAQELPSEVAEAYLDYEAAFEAGRPALELNVYPNPARDALWVDLPADWQESEFALFSADGRIVRTWKQGHGQPISLQELPTGVYLLKVQFGEAIGLARFRKF